VDRPLPTLPVTLGRAYKFCATGSCVVSGRRNGRDEGARSWSMRKGTLFTDSHLGGLKKTSRRMGTDFVFATKTKHVFLFSSYMPHALPILLTWICLTAGEYVRSDASDLTLAHSHSHK
jgi:hypothetical protein